MTRSRWSDIFEAIAPVKQAVAECLQNNNSAVAQCNTQALVQGGNNANINFLPNGMPTGLKYGNPAVTSPSSASSPASWGRQKSSDFHKQMLQALNLAIVANLSLQQTRIGEVSIWKACAMANAGRNAVFAASLAKEGLTGPGPIFEGLHAFFKVVSGPFELKDFGGGGRPFRIMDATIKRFPFGLFSQSAVDAALRLRSKISTVEEVAQVTVGTFKLGKAAMGSDPEKWRPQTRESADHSLPYVFATALI